MAIATLDTHQLVKRLRGVGFTDEQAEALTDTLRGAQNATLSEIVTKTDLALTEQKLNARIDEVEQKLNARIDGLEQKLNARIDGLEQRLNIRIDGLEQRMTIKFGGMAAAAIGIVAVLVRLL
jgi:hypothetical protein